MKGRFRYRFSVIGKFPAGLPGNDNQVTVNVAAGPDDHLVHCGTLTMTDDELERLATALTECLGEDFILEWSARRATA